MTLSRDEFNIIAGLMNSSMTSTQFIANEVPVIPCTAERGALSGLIKRGFINHDGVTGKGRDAIEQYRVRRAVILAAGIGMRLKPITVNTPKPLIRVNGKRIIDSLLDAVIAAGIEEIYVVRGYLGEQFDQLLYQYPMIRFIDNPVYNETNNISSALCVKELFRNAYVFEGDILLRNQLVITPYQYANNYLGYPVERTDDWFLVVENGIIKRMQHGGVSGYLMGGISYWDEDAGSKLERHIPMAYALPEGGNRLWDTVALECFHNEYKVEIRTCADSDFVEIDSFEELQQIDSTYRVTL